MGILKILFPKGVALHRLAQTCDECLNCFDRYNSSGNKNELLKVAWLYTYGVQNSMYKYVWNLNSKIIVPNHPEIGARIPLTTLIVLILSPLAKYGKDEGLEEEISEILKGNEIFDSYSHLISSSLKKKLKP